jgi:hypothetical protein
MNNQPKMTGADRKPPRAKFRREVNVLDKNPRPLLLPTAPLPQSIHGNDFPSVLSTTAFHAIGALAGD